MKPSNDILLIGSILSAENSDEDNYTTVVSPLNQDLYNHVVGVDVKKTDGYDAWEGRGGTVTITLQSEESREEFCVKIGFHKGQVSMWVESLGSYSEDKEDLLR